MIEEDQTSATKEEWKKKLEEASDQNWLKDVRVGLA